VAGAGSFDGDGDYVEISDDPTLDLTDAFSIAAWVNTSQDQDPYARLVSREQSGAGNRQYNLGFTPGGERARTIVDTTSTNSIEVVGTTDLTDGSWHHVVVTCDVAATSLRLYVDNSEEDDETINDPVVSRASDVVLGAVAHTPSNLPYEGAIDDVRIYDRALSSSEVTALYNNTNL